MDFFFRVFSIELECEYSIGASFISLFAIVLFPIEYVEIGFFSIFLFLFVFILQIVRKFKFYDTYIEITYIFRIYKRKEKIFYQDIKKIITEQKAKQAPLIKFEMVNKTTSMRRFFIYKFPLRSEDKRNKLLNDLEQRGLKIVRN